MKTAPYELTPEDHLSPDGAQERITDPKKAAHMGHAAHLAFRHAEAEMDARRLMIAWHEDGKNPDDTAREIYEMAVERAGKRMYDAHDIDLDYYDPYNQSIHGVPKRPRNDSTSALEGVDQDMVVANEAIYLAIDANRQGAKVEDMPASHHVTGRDGLMDDAAETTGKRYDNAMNRLSRFKDVDVS